MSDETRLVWLRVDFIFSRSVMEEIGVISLNKHADSMEKVTTVNWSPEYYYYYHYYDYYYHYF